MKKIILCILFGINQFAFSQVSDNFFDGDFTTNPSWTGIDSLFTIASGELRSNSLQVNKTYYLSTPSTIINEAKWKFKTRLLFNTSSANYVDAYIIANNADLLNTGLTGYFVRIGGTSDRISLFKKNGATETEIITGINGITNSSLNELVITVTRSAGGLFTLTRDNLLGTNPIIEGTITDNTFNTTNHFGFLIKHSTASFFSKHFFDDIDVSILIADITPPQITSVTALSSNSVQVVFNEVISATTATNILNYNINNGVIVNTASQVTGNTILLSTNNLLANTYQLSIANIADLAGNTVLLGTSVNFKITNAPVSFEVIINEIMADPSPIIGLPEIEYIELVNTSAQIFNLKDLQITVNTNAPINLPNYELAPNEYVVISNAGAGLLGIPNAINVNKDLALSNEGAVIQLKNKLGDLVHVVNYSLAYYNSAAKDDGGWSLELLNYKNPCGNFKSWLASNGSLGGTPGQVNSVYQTNYLDKLAPKLIRTYMKNADTLLLYYSEPINNLNVSNFTIEELPNLTFNTIVKNDLLGMDYKLSFSDTLAPGKIYTLKNNQLYYDCAGNANDKTISVNVARNQLLQKGDLIINEVLPYAKDLSDDWVEIANVSNKVIDMKGLQLATFDKKNKTLESIKSISSNGFSIYPNKYVVLISNASSVLDFYDVKNPEQIVEMEALPVFSSDSGVVILLQGGNRLDSMQYYETMHYPLLNTTKGISLERISNKRLSTDVTNWTSAAQTFGYASPTSINSQNNESANGTKTRIEPNVFSPDADGYNDVTTIYYEYDKTGYVQSIHVFDLNGNKVTSLQQNTLVAQTGSISWDGFSSTGEKAGIGAYIVFIDAFNTDGSIKKTKLTVTIATKI